MFVLTLSVQRQNGSTHSNDSHNINVQEETPEKMEAAFKELDETVAEYKAKYTKKAAK